MSEVGSLGRLLPLARPLKWWMLDLLAERDLLESISMLAEGRTTILITHRLVGLQSVGEILVMREGTIVERGTHGELLLRDGVYARMWRLQAEVLDSNPERAS